MKVLKHTFLLPLLLSAICGSISAAESGDKSAPEKQASQTEAIKKHSDIKIDPATQKKIESAENQRKSIRDELVKIAVKIDPLLSKKKRELQIRIVLRKANQYARKDKLFSRLLAEYIIQQRYILRLNPKHPIKDTVATTESDSTYPRPDVNALSRPELPESIRKRKWSWDRIYRYISIHKRGEFSEDEIRTIASFDMIQVGADASGLGLAGKLKKHNPNIICIGYRNSIIWHKTFNSDLFRQNPTWFLKNYRTGKYETHGRTGLKAKKPLFDFRVPGMRDWWLRDIARQCETEELDGVLIDAFAKVLGDWGPKRRSIGADPQSKMEYSKLFLDKILKENIKVNGNKGLIIANALRSGYDDCLKSYVDVLLHGSYMEWIEGGRANYEEGLSKLIDTLIQIGKDPGDKLLCFQFHAGYPPPPRVKIEDADNRIPESNIMPAMGEHFDAKGKTHEDIVKEMREAFPYKLAIFLICANRFSYMGYGSTALANNGQARWAPQYPEHRKKIGKPLGHAVKKGKYYYERHFEHVTVKLNIETREAVLDWK